MARFVLTSPFVVKNAAAVGTFLIVIASQYAIAPSDSSHLD